MTALPPVPPRGPGPSHGPPFPQDGTPDGRTDYAWQAELQIGAGPNQVEIVRKGNEMERGEFIKCCMAGVCACAVSTLAPVQVRAAGEADDLKWKMDFVHHRFAKLVQILRDNVDEQTRNKIFENLGRECARQFTGLTEKYRGDIKGFLAAIQQRWAEGTEYDEKTGAIRVVDKASTCTCALVDQSMTPADFCHCTIGWQKQAYSTVLGRPVEVDLEESILRGGKKCIFRIRPA